jgi:beta-lactamase regulating signal transducer with metallopeptidase domain
VDAILEIGLLNALLAAALALAAVGLTALCRRPALAHALWLLVLLKLVTPPAVPLTLTLPAPAAEATAPPPLPSAEPAAPLSDLPAPPAEDLPSGPALDAAGEPDPEPPDPRPLPWRPVLACLWLAGSGLWWGLAAVRLARFRRLLRSARPAPPEVRARARELAGRLGLARCPGVWLLDAPLPPLLWCLLGRPRVLLPARLWRGLTAEQRDTLLAHELAHVRRRDHWVRRLELVALGLYWWHPAAWWARRRLQEAEELLCDARVVRALPGAAGAYAEALFKTVAFLSGPRPALPGAASGLGQVRVLKRRMTMIVRGTTAERLPRAAAWALLAVGAAALVLRPGWAQAQAAEAPAPAAVAPAQQAGPAVGAVAPVRAAAAAQEPAVALGQGAAKPPAEAVAPPRAVGVEKAAGDPQAAREEVELLRAQLEARQAELQEARALLARARRVRQRHEQLHKQGAVSVELLDQARADAEVQQARVRAKEAQVREARLRLAQAQRRLTGRAPAGRRPGRPLGELPGLGARPEPVPLGFSGGAPAPRKAPPGVAPVPEIRTAPAPDDRSTEERLQQLERQVQQLLREVRSLRQKGQPRGTTGRPAVGRPAVEVAPALPAPRELAPDPGPKRP